MGKIAIYGGSFDPPHLGHKLLAENLAAACDADFVYVVPAASSPFKDGANTSGDDRIKMCELCFDNPLFKVSDIEINRGGKSYTVDTVRAIKELHPESELFLFMGDDMLLSFNKWYKFNEILSMCRIVTACRNENLSKLSEMKCYAEKYLGGSENVIIADCVPIEISSTEIRNNLKNGVYDKLSDAVYEYIKIRGLYDVQK